MYVQCGLKNTLSDSVAYSVQTVKKYRHGRTREMKLKVISWYVTLWENIYSVKSMRISNLEILCYFDKSNPAFKCSKQRVKFPSTKQDLHSKAHTAIKTSNDSNDQIDMKLTQRCLFAFKNVAADKLNPLQIISINTN